MKTHHNPLLTAHTAAIAIALAIAGSAQAQTTYTWTGAGSNNSWSQAAQWEGSPTVAMTSQDAVVFYSGAGSRLDNFIQLDRTINSLSFNANADSDVLIGMGGTQGSKNITFAGTNPHITVNAGSEGNHVIGHNDAAETRQGLVVLNADLLIAHNGAGDLTIRRPITEDATARGITKNGSGALFSLGNNTYTGATTVEMGKLTITGTTFASSGIAISSGATFSFANASGTLGYHNTTNHQISGAGTLMKEGAGTVELSAEGRGTTISMSSGALIDIQGGTLRNGQWNNAVWTDNLADLNIAAGATFDTWNGAPIRVNALTGEGSIVNGIGGTTSLTLGVDGGSGTFSGAITAVGLSLVKEGAGTQTLTSVNTYTGAININAGTLEAAAATSGDASAIGNGANTINIAQGATLLFSTNDRTAGIHSGTVNLNGGTITFNSDDVSLVSGKTLTLDTAPGTIDGSGQWRMRGDNAKVAVTAAASGSSIGVTNLELTFPITGGYVFEVADGAAANDLTVSSNITGYAGGEGITKQGSGTLVLAGTSTYTGATSVSAGTLLVTGELGATNLTVGADGLLGGGGTLGGDLHFDTGAGLVFSLTDTLMVDGATVSFDGFSIANLFGFDNTVPVGTYFLLDGLATVSTTNLGNLGLANAYVMGGTGKQAYFETGSLNLVVIPEPRAALLGGLGLLALLRRRRA